MRPTRWTKQRRVTYQGKGGWRIHRWGFGYVHPVTGDGVSAGWNLRRALEMRREQEARRIKKQADREWGQWLYEAFKEGRLHL